MIKPASAPRGAARLAWLLLCAPVASAQQFQYQPGLIPGTARWSEGVEAADVDNDGDLDLLFADGEGFSTAGAQRQNVLIINKLVETGPGIYADESVARLGVNLSNAKGVTTADVNGDGWVDVLFANAFNTDPPSLYINQGAANPGFFTLESAARGLTTSYSSAGAQFGDLDGDGDLDLILCDSGPSFLALPGGKPHFFRNDGAGFFTEDPGTASWPTKVSHMDVSLADVDNDWDLDFVGACRHANNPGGYHYLMLNDGTGTFSNSSTTVPNTSSNTYELEVGDLDGDVDLDLFFVSITSFAEGAARNNFVPSSALSFTSMGGLPDGNDDNEIVLLDYDNDGDLDPIVASLGAREALWRNDGSFTFVNIPPSIPAATGIQAISDSSLDAAVADLDNDGDYDLITAQGESNPGQWVNKIYLNTGAPDTLAPVMTGLRPTAGAAPLDPYKVLAKVRDQVMDDGVAYVASFARYVVNSSPHSAGVTVDGSGFMPGVLAVPVGTTVVWTHGGGGAQSVTSATPPYDFDSGSFSSGTYSYTFVSPGTYDYTSTPSGATGQVVVTGTAGEVEGKYVGGGMHRFELPTHGSQLCYELWFQDWPGNASVTRSRVAALVNPFPPFCDASDGALAACPCSNPGHPTTGCDIQQGTGGVELDVLARETSPQNRVTARGMGFPAATTPSALVIRGSALDSASPVVFGDGLRCVAAPLVRLAGTLAAGGVSTHEFGHGAAAGAGTFYYQLWFRNTPAMFCTPDAFNLSSGRTIVW